MMRRVIRIFLFITFCCVLVGNRVGAQQTFATTPKPSPTNPVPTPIPLSEIASQGESASESLRDIETSLSTDQLTATVEKRLPQLTNEIDLRTAEMGRLLASSLPLDFLHFMEVTSQRFRDELSTENHDLTERTRTLDDQIAQLDKLSMIWKSTLQLPELYQAAPEIPKRMQSLIDHIGRVQTALSALERAEANAVRNLFVQDSPPIWRLGVDSWQEESHLTVVWRAT